MKEQFLSRQANERLRAAAVAAGVAAAVGTAGMLAGCSGSDDGAGPRDGAEIRVTARVVGSDSRATDTSWERGDRIGVSDDKGNTNVCYETDAAGGSTIGFRPVENGIAIRGNSEAAFTAFYPYDEGVTAADPEIEISVADAQGNYNAVASEVDLMYAPEVRADVSNPDVALSFSHKMTKIAFVIRDGSNTVDTARCRVSYEISGVRARGRFNTQTGEVTRGEETSTLRVGDVALGRESAVFLPSVSPAASRAAAAEPLGVTVSVLDTRTQTVDRYAATIEPALEEGSQYNYTLSFKYGEGMNVASSSIVGMTSAGSSEKDLSGAGTSTGATGASTAPLPQRVVAAVGDFLMRDGSIVPASAGVSSRRSDVMAVVFYAPSDDDSRRRLLDNGYPYCSGLAMSIDVAGDGSETQYGPNGEVVAGGDDVPMAFQTSNAEISLRNAVNLANTPAYGRDFKLSDTFSDYADGMFDFHGWNNTQLWVWINDRGSDDQTQWRDVADNMVKSLRHWKSLHAFDGSANVSGWYLPSMRELVEIKRNSTGIKASVTNAGGVFAAVPTSGAGALIDGGCYWSSDSRSNTHQWAHNLYSEPGDLEMFVPRSSFTGMFYFAVAF